MVFISVFNISFCSYIVFLILFSCLPVCSCSSLNFLKRIILNSLSVHRSSIFLGSVIETLFPLLASCLPNSFWSLYTWIGICAFEYRTSFSRLYRFVLEGKDLYLSPQFGVLDRSAGSICNQSRLAIEVFSWVRPLSILWGQGGRSPGWILHSGGAATWTPWLGEAAGYVLWLNKVTGWAPCQGKATDCVRQSSRALCYALLLGGVVDWVLWLGGTVG